MGIIRAFICLLFITSSTIFTTSIKNVDSNCQEEGGNCINPEFQQDENVNEQKLEEIKILQAEIPKGANELGKPKQAEIDCIDRHEQCRDFYNQGECSNNPGWMIINCPKSCQSCHLRDPKLRCDRKTLNISTSPIYLPGQMETMFSSIQSRFHHQYNITILSQSPWVVVIDDFLTDDESKALITTVDKWERSTDSGETNEFGETGRVVSTGRTSSNAWCREACEKNPHVQSIMSKIEQVTLVPRGNYESFQVLRYEKDQRYVVHHDYGVEDVGLACGPRILTFFLYMSDVEEGGETNFPSLGIAVKPKKGRALLWPSTLDSNPEEQDTRTFHEAKPVIQGKKFAANAWIHLYNFAIPNLWGCTGAFDEL